MKKLISVILCCALVLALTGCAGTTVVVGNCTCPPESHDEGSSSLDNIPLGPVLKTGLAIVPSIAKSASATADTNGKADYDVTVVAVLVDYKGIIRDCVIDSVAKSVEFDAAGVPAAPGTIEVKTKNELGEAYGMKAAGSAYEWNEQAQALADYAVGKTVAQLKNGAVNEAGKAKDADLATKATVYIGGYVSAIEEAVANAQDLGALEDHELKLAVNATMDAKDGKIQLDLDAVALTMAGDHITSCTIDSLQAPVEFDSTGTITSELSAPKTKNQLGFDYNMVNYGASTMEWFEQTAFFCRYVAGKTAEDVAGIHVNEEQKPTDVDLTTGCTISIGNFQKLIAKAVG